MKSHENSVGPPGLEYIDASDGYNIPLITWLPTAPRAVVQLAHGMGEHAGRYDRLARTLMSNGYAVYANHHRGHGPEAACAATRGELGSGGFARLVEDMSDVSRVIQKRHPGLPLVMIGHSMGSFAAQIYAVTHSKWLQALVLSGSAATDLLEQGRRTALGNLAQIGNNRTSPRTPYDWLTRDNREVDLYLADPLCGFLLEPVSMASMFDTCSRTTLIGGFSTLRPTLPIYAVTGSCDPVNDYLEWFYPLVQRLRDANLNQVFDKVYEGARHEVFNETNREEIIADLLTWLAGACGHSCGILENTNKNVY